MALFSPPPEHLLVINHLYIKADCVDAFKAAVDTVLPESSKETGLFRFEYLQDRNDPTHFTFIDLFSDEKAFQAHLATDHLRRFAEEIADLQAAPHEGAFFTAIRVMDKGSAST